MKTNFKFEIKKDGFIPSKPWSADVVFNDGKIWKSWSYGFKTKKSLVEHCQYVRPNIEIVYA